MRASRAARILARALDADAIEDLFATSEREWRAVCRVLAGVVHASTRAQRTIATAGRLRGVGADYVIDRVEVLATSLAALRREDPYATLGVTSDAAPEVIQRRWRELAKTFHPDVAREPASDDTFQRLRAAYEIVRDPERRLRWDAMHLRPGCLPAPRAAALFGEALDRESQRRPPWIDPGRIVRSMVRRGRDLVAAGGRARAATGRGAHVVARGVTTAGREAGRTARRVGAGAVDRASRRAAGIGTATATGTAAVGHRIGTLAVACRVRLLAAWMRGGAQARRISGSIVRSAILTARMVGRAALWVVVGIPRSLAAAVWRVVSTALVTTARAVDRVGIGILALMRGVRVLASSIVAGGKGVASTAARSTRGALAFALRRAARHAPAMAIAVGVIAAVGLSLVHSPGSRQRDGAGGAANDGAPVTMAGRWLDGSADARAARAPSGGEAASTRAQSLAVGTLASRASSEGGSTVARRPQAMATPGASSGPSTAAETSIAVATDDDPTPADARTITPVEARQIPRSMPEVTPAGMPSLMVARVRPQSGPSSRSRAAGAWPAAAPEGVAKAPAAAATEVDGHPGAGSDAARAGISTVRAKGQGPSAEPVQTAADHAAPGASDPIGITRTQAAALLASFRRHYERREIDELGALFTEDAVENARRGRSAIKAAYRSALMAWRDIEYRLGRVTYEERDDAMQLRSPFVITYGRPDGGRIVRGTAAWDIVRRGDALRIARLSYEIER